MSVEMLAFALFWSNCMWAVVCWFGVREFQRLRANIEFLGELYGLSSAP